MEIRRNRPVITDRDHPLTVYEALRNSISYWQQNMPREISFLWEHKAQNAYGTLRTDFSIINGEVHRPQSESVLWDINMDQLELALVAYGCDILDQDNGKNSSEIIALDGLLKEIDRAKSRNVALATY